LENEAGGVSLRFLAHEAVRRSLAPPLAEPKIGVVGMGVRTRSLKAAAGALARGGVRPAVTSADRIAVPLPTRWASCSTSCPDCSRVAPQNFFEMPAK
jgi:hypothetical protein